MRALGVTAIIPTTLRTEVSEAIRSVRAQRFELPIEIVAVVDRSESECTDVELLRVNGADQVVFTGGNRRGGFARNLGVAHASGDWLAFLDDDDTWAPNKIAAQVEAASSHSAATRTVFATRVVQAIRGETRTSRPVPDRPITESERIEDYLFRKRRPVIGRAGVFTSTLFVSQELARGVAWDTHLARHQDWDWLMRLQLEGAKFLQLDTVGATIWMGSAGSISASANWEQSLSWARRWKQSWSRQTYVDFVAGQAMRYATQARSARGIASTVQEIMRSRRFPNLGPLLLGLGGLVPRKLALRSLLRSGSTVESNPINV